MTEKKLIRNSDVAINFNQNAKKYKRDNTTQQKIWTHTTTWIL
jgi:hypothetical protein